MQIRQDNLGGEFMAYCEKCGKETKEGQIFCEECLAEMEESSFGDLFDSLGQSENMEQEENSADDDFTKILEELQGPREENDQPDSTETEQGPSTVSDVFSDAVSAISSLEDELEDMLDLDQQQIETEPEKKKGFFARLFGRKSKKNEEEADSGIESIDDLDSPKLDKKALKKAEKEKAKLEKAERARKKAEEAKKAKAEKDKAKAEKAKAKAEKAKEKKAKSKKDDAKKAKPKKEKPKKEKKKKQPDVEEVIVEDTGHFNIPVLIFVFIIFIAGTGFILLKTLNSSYNYTIAAASRKFDNQKYTQAYEEINGVRLKKNDEELYDKIMTVMYVNKQLNSYNNYMALDMYPEALDSLVKGLKRYDTYIDHAKELKIEDDLDYVRDQILKVLKKKFGVSEKKAKKLMKIEDRTQYSLKIYDIVLENSEYAKKLSK